MTRPSNYERDAEIYKKIKPKNKKDKWSFRQVASFYNLAPSSVHEAFKREEARRKKGSVIHS